jgi:DNA invertase Pin-like site-specific DNA recombinase
MKDIKAASKMPKETSGRRKGKFVKNMGVITKKWALFIDRGYKGTDFRRPQLLAAIALAEEKPSQSFIIVSDFQRWSRDARKGIVLADPLYSLNVPLVSQLDGETITGTQANPDGTADLLWLVQVALGAAEVEKARKREKRTRDELQARGVYTSARLTLYPFAKADPWTLMQELYPKVESDELSLREFGKEVSERAAPNGPSPTWYVKALKKLITIQNALTKEDFDDWNYWRTQVRDFEREKGYDFGGKGFKGKKDFTVIAVGRRTGAFLTEPQNYLNRKPDDEIFEDAILNVKEYLGKADITAFNKQKK